jgi:tyrosyl-tRNA synthetase
MPTFELSKAQLADGLNVVDLLAVSGLAPSKGEGRRLVQQGGVSIDGNKIDDISYVISEDLFVDGKIVVKKGKKVFLKIVLA